MEGDLDDAQIAGLQEAAVGCRISRAMKVPVQVPSIIFPRNAFFCASEPTSSSAWIAPSVRSGHSEKDM